MSEIKQPQDRKPKVKKYSFTGADGEERTLPFASEGASKVPGRITRDAIMGADDAAEIRLGFALLEACGAPKETEDALYDLPTDEMIRILGEWMEFGDGQGATVPQS